jgi:hypothetical protein
MIELDGFCFDLAHAPDLSALVELAETDVRAAEINAAIDEALSDFEITFE